MSRLILIRGPAGVGKTTISKLISRKINSQIIHFDDIMNNIGLDYIEGEKWIPLNKFLKADKIMIPKFRKILEGGENLIIDGNFYHREQIEDISKNIDFPISVFTLKASLSDCIERDNKREGKLGKNATTDVFELASDFDYGIVIDTRGKTPSEITGEIISYLKNQN